MLEKEAIATFAGKHVNWLQYQRFSTSMMSTFVAQRALLPCLVHRSASVQCKQSSLRTSKRKWVWERDRESESITFSTRSLLLSRCCLVSTSVCVSFNGSFCIVKMSFRSSETYCYHIFRWAHRSSTASFLHQAIVFCAIAISPPHPLFPLTLCSVSVFFMLKLFVSSCLCCCFKQN